MPESTESAGRALARAFSTRVVEPAIRSAMPALRFSTARLGSGSEVLGYDDGTSRDHDWGPRLSVVAEPDAVTAIERVLDERLPPRFEGRAVRFAMTGSPAVRHRVEVDSPSSLVHRLTGVEGGRPSGVLDHLSLTGQSVLELTAGPVLRDDDDVLAALRTSFAMPADVRRWAVASAWRRIEQELPFVGRTAERGDAPGSRVLAARLVHTAMRLGFLLEDRPAPYAKWLGTAFAALPHAGAAAPLLEEAISAAGWPQREAALAAACDLLARLQGRTGLPTLEPATRPFWDRPFRGLRDLPVLVRATIEDPALRALPLVGPPDLWTDDVGLLTDHGLRRRAVAALLGLPAGGVGGAA